MSSRQSADYVATLGQDEVILAIDATRARRERGLDDGFARVVQDLVYGVPVAGSELDRWGITAIGLLTAEEAAEIQERQGALFN